MANPQHWHYAQFELNSPKPGTINPVLSPAAGDHATAHTKVQELLDRTARELGATAPQLRQVAEKWRAGAKDDTVFWGTFIWTLFECAGDCRASAEACLQEWAGIIGRNGTPVSIPSLPADWPSGHTLS